MTASVEDAKIDSWRPSFKGKLFSNTGSWSLQIGPDRMSFRVMGLDGSTGWVQVPAADVSVERHWPWSKVVVKTADVVWELPGLPRDQGRTLDAALKHCRHLTALRTAFDQGLQQVTSWSTALKQELRRWELRWWPRELLERLRRSRPTVDSRFGAARVEPDLQNYLLSQPDHVQQALAWWDTNLSAHAATRNQRFVTEEAKRRRNFFAKVEASPLTAEQVKAVVCFDNRVQVVAAAGSGKTSTMVARAAYAVQHGLVPPERILMLAFNSDAATELQQRVRRRIGDRAGQITVSTFHAFGLKILGEVSNHKPRVAPGLGNSEAEGNLRFEEVVDALRDRDLGFRMQWDLFRLVFGRPLVEFEETEDAEAWDPDSRVSGFRTLGGEVVKSREELMLANWLFYNGVNYKYEKYYEHDTADAAHGRYRPDFYYPDIDVYHEHWALNRDGQPPPQFSGYLDGVRWKRDTHAQYGTTLLETTSATVRDGTAFSYLAGELTARGIALDPNPDRKVVGEQPLQFEQLVTVMRTFLTHFKSNRLNERQLRDRIQALPGGRWRAGLFVDLFLPVLREWDQRLRDADEVDFEDMINRATDAIEKGTWTSPYDLVMVDEMQDSSHARSRLVQGLVNAPDRYLFCVGDDWQSIYRFAGSDLTVMTRFTNWFGAGHTLKLERTFRSPQSICNASSQFVTRNPEQITKHVRSHQPEHPPALRAVAVAADDQYAAVIINDLRPLDTAEAAPNGRPLQVLILGRYKTGKDKIQAVLNHRWQHLKVRYSTVHKAKGAEADYVIVIDLTARGFPSVVQDDPLLTLAMPSVELYPHAEERRLFYVALTRTRRSVLLLTVANRESPFLLELIKARQVTLTSASGEPISVTPCPNCKEGRLVRRTNRKNNSDFLGCSQFPKCSYTRNISVKRPNQMS